MHATSPPPDAQENVLELVEKMVLDAQHNSEVKVGNEVTRLKQTMASVSDKIQHVAQMLNKKETRNAHVFKTDLQKSIAMLQAVWEAEVGALKVGLWQTITAHNSNADLLKLHKEATDQLRTSIPGAAPSSELEQLNAQLVQVDKFIQRENAKEYQINQLLQRVSALQHKLSAKFLAAASATAIQPPAAKKGSGSAAAKTLNCGVGSAAYNIGCAPTCLCDTLLTDVVTNGSRNYQFLEPRSSQAVKAEKASKAAGPAFAHNLRAEAPPFVPGEEKQKEEGARSE